MYKRAMLFLEMIRFSHTLFALPFALLSAVLAWQVKDRFQWLELAGILLCMVFARSVAMAFNRIADRKIDADNPRTAVRHLPSGKLGVTETWLFLSFCAVAFIGSTTLFLLTEPPNMWPPVLSVPVLLFICAYSFTKRFTSLAHFWLGASLLLAPVAAWIAILGMQRIEVALVLGGAVMFWVAGFDIIYACQDAEFDRKAKLSSIPATVGVANALRIAALSHVVMIVLLVALWWIATPHLKLIYLGGVSLVAILLVYEHLLVSPTKLDRVNQAFFHVNTVVSLGLFLLVLLQVYVKW